MLKLNLSKRPAKIGGSINTRTERHGEEEVPGLDIPIGGMLVNAEELAALTDSLTAHEAFFAQDTATGFVPRIQAIEVYPINHKFEGASVRITGSQIESMSFGDAKIKSIKLVPQIGGLTLVSFTLQVNPAAGEVDVPLLLNQKISIGIKSAVLEQEADNEPELPLDHTQDEIDQAEREEAEATAKVTGRAKGRPRKSRDPVH